MVFNLYGRIDFFTSNCYALHFNGENSMQIIEKLIKPFIHKNNKVVYSDNELTERIPEKHGLLSASINLADFNEKDIVSVLTPSGKELPFEKRFDKIQSPLGFKYIGKPIVPSRLKIGSKIICGRQSQVTYTKINQNEWLEEVS